MVTLVNEDLFSFAISEETPRDGGEPYFKLRVLSTNKIVHAPRDPEGHATNEKFFNPVIRDIVTITSPEEDFNKYNTTLSVNDNGKTTQVRVRCTTDPNRKTCNLFAIAIPFNGMLTPIAPSKDYRIYKGLIVTSARAFWFNNNRFRKVLYLVIEPNVNLFTNLTGIHKDEISLQIEAYGIFKDYKNNKEEKTNHDIHRVAISYHPEDTDLPFHADYEFTRNEIDHPVVMERDPSQTLWTQFKFTKKNNYPDGGGHFSQRQEYDRPRERRGSSYGDRQKGSYSSNARKSEPVDPEAKIERMIADSGMRETGKRIYEERNGGGKRGKKNKYR